MLYPYEESEKDGHNNGTLDNYWWYNYTKNEISPKNWWLETKYAFDVFPSLAGADMLPKESC